MKKKGFTLVELLVVIAIIAMLLAILMPALGKVRQLAYRLMCGTNQAGLGKAMMVYANDYAESYPKAKATIWYNSTTATTAPANFNWNQVLESAAGPRTVTASLFLLVKYADVSAAQFVCQSATQKKFDINKTDTTAQNYVGTGTQYAQDVTGCWDFGTLLAGPKGPWDYCSYSFQLPYGNFSPSASSAAGIALLADRNPLIDPTANKENYDGSTTNNITAFFSLVKANLTENNKMKQGNSAAHQGEGQNILFADSHVSFEKTPNVGVQLDNIYTPWRTTTSPTETDIQLGLPSTYKTLAPCTTTTTCLYDSQTSDDSFLVNDGPLLK